MKITKEAQILPDGSIEPAHEIELVCAHCNDPVSEVEVTTGKCSNCGEYWLPNQSVTVTVTSMPAIEGITISIG